MSGEVLRREASSLMRMLRHLRGRHRGFTTTELMTLLAVAENEGVTVNGLGQLCGFTTATASRTSRGLAPADMPGALSPCRGLLVLMRGPHENRNRHLFLTPSGRALCEDMDRILAQGRGAAILLEADEAA